ncbi:NAD(P)H-quinone oxidoreductase [Rhodohalobacter mucosus]|uniref:NADPH:quinone oxidoreductase n=1 Tax=Rhodohalobacter mucosus TaxID=2079485 RepID=A0A316TZ89_9BACT|nr:NAD(P)H-quinone oxidoreductase [Rhodohalobacter mucosus]PWN05336.1 NADPH:quinone oxidoreductase [Rhodohalobacter mucosus]
MKALLVDHQNGSPVMRTGTFPDPVPGDRELLVKTEAAALNRADLLQKAGKYPPPDGESPILGLEMSGVVEQAGKDVEGFKPGDPVFGLLGGGGYAEYCIIDYRMARIIPENFSFEEAAAIPEVFLTAYQALFLLGRLEKRETVLIHAGASGVGTAAIQLARVLKDATVLATAGTPEKLTLCRELGADLAINYKKESFAEPIIEHKGPDSTNLIIDFIGAPYWHDNLRIAATDGRIIYLSMLGGSKIDSISLVPVLKKRLTIAGSTLRNRNAEYKIDLMRKFWEDSADKFPKQEIKPVIDSIYDWKDAEKAHQYMADNRNAGKIILMGM